MMQKPLMTLNLLMTVLVFKLLLIIYPLGQMIGVLTLTVGNVV